MPPLFKTSIQISLLLLSFLPLDNYIRSRRAIRWLIGIGDANVKDTWGLFFIQAWMSKSPRSNQCPSIWTELAVGAGVDCCVCADRGSPFERVSWLIWINGSSRTRLELVARVARYANSSRTSLCLTVTSPPFLHPSACSTEDFAPHPSYFLCNNNSS